MTDRAKYIEGLRAFASILELHPELPLPVYGRTLPMTMGFWGETARGDLTAAARAFPCAWRKEVRDSEDGSPSYFDLESSLAGLAVKLTAYREAVCTRVVTGTEEHEVDEVVTPAVTRKVTKQVETFEWDCGTLLGPRPAAAPAFTGLPVLDGEGGEDALDAGVAEDAPIVVTRDELTADWDRRHGIPNPVNKGGEEEHHHLASLRDRDHYAPQKDVASITEIPVIADAMAAKALAEAECPATHTAEHDAYFYYCTEPAGHHGDHIARGGGSIAAQWAQEGKS
jgi:hypothetical protein